MLTVPLFAFYKYLNFPANFEISKMADHIYETKTFSWYYFY